MSDTNSSQPGLFAECWTEAQFAKERKLSPRTLRAERQRGAGPPYVRDGRKIYYPIATAREWLQRKLHIPVRSEARRFVPPSDEPRKRARKIQAQA